MGRSTNGPGMLDCWALLEAIRSTHALDVCLALSLSGPGAIGLWRLTAYVVRPDVPPWEERVLFSMDTQLHAVDTRPLETILYQFLVQVDGEIGRSYRQASLPTA